MTTRKGNTVADTITNELLDTLQVEMREALAVVAAKHGVSITIGASTFTNANAIFKLQVAVIGEHGLPDTREAEQFRFAASSYGLSPDDLGRSFVYDGKNYTIVGLSRKSPKYPILCTCETGGDHRFAARLVASSLAQARASAWRGNGGPS